MSLTDPQRLVLHSIHDLDSPTLDEVCEHVYGYTGMPRVDVARAVFTLEQQGYLVMSDSEDISLTADGNTYTALHIMDSISNGQRKQAVFQFMSAVTAEQIEAIERMVSAGESDVIKRIIMGLFEDIDKYEIECQKLEGLS